MLHRRIYPKQILNKRRLSLLFDRLLQELEEEPMNVLLETLSYETRIPEQIIMRLRHLHCQPEDDPEIKTEDYHLIFTHILIHYPTVQIFELPDGTFFFRI